MSFGCLDLLHEQRKAKVPDAELDVFYGFASMRAESQNDPVRLAEIDALEHQVKTTPGVIYRGRVGQKELAQAFKSAKVWSYPTMFWECCCITSLECQAAGCVPVTTALGSLKETVRSGLLLAPPIDVRYEDQFVASVVQLLQDDILRKSCVARGLKFANNESWTNKAKEWLLLFDK